MKKTSSLLFSLFAVILLNAQDFNAEFTKALRDGDTLKQREILSSWERLQNKNADYYIASFHYYLSNSINENTRNLDIESLGRSFDAIDEGIEKFPARLDMRTGKISALYRFGMWNEYTDEVIKAIDYSYIIDNKWIYPDEKADKDFFLNIIQQYQADLFDETDLEEFSYEDSLQILRIKQISQTVLKYYPDNVEALNNEGAAYFFENNYSKALEVFLKAEKINPKDEIVLFNIANIYAKQGDKNTAKQYYENIIKNCGQQAASQANILLKEL